MHGEDELSVCCIVLFVSPVFAPLLLVWRDLEACLWELEVAVIAELYLLPPLEVWA